jgi:hypothetical protein
MAVLKGHKSLAAPFKNEGELVRVIYDFSVDGGSTADYDVLTAQGDMICEHVGTHVLAAVTGTNLDLDLGKGAGGVQFHSDVDPSAILLNTVISGGSTRHVVLAAGDKIVMGIETAAATAGKLEFMFRIYRR